MPKFDTPAFIKPTDPSGDVIVFGKEPVQEQQDLLNGVARFGGTWRTPSYQLAYQKAARMLIRHGISEKCLDDIALPAFYMLRHSLELLLKRLLYWLYEEADFQRERIGDKDDPLSQGQRDRLSKSHNLRSLLRDLETASRQFRHGEPPPEISKAVEQLSAFELSDTWSRYEVTKSKDGKTLHHVKEEVEVPLLAICDVMEALKQTVGYRMDDDSTYECQLYEAWLFEARASGHAG